MSGASSRRELRPQPLSLSKQSRKIRKQQAAPPPEANSHRHHQPPPAPVIIYSVSPKKIHVEPEEFMALVQRLTGANPAASDGNAEPHELRATHFVDGGVQMPHNLLGNATHDDSNHLNRNLNNLTINMPSATASNVDVFSYFYDI